MSRTLKITPTESVTVRESMPELLEVEATYGPEGKEPPRHYHPSQDEHFEVLAGTVAVRVAGEERLLATGETIDIPRRTPHQMWNPGDVFRLSAGPEPLVRGGLGLLAPLGRMRGYLP